MEACKFFLQGRCIYGSACKNRHEAVLSDPALEPLASTSPREKQDQDGRRANSKPCVHFVMGNCKYATQCRNIHSAGDEGISWRATLPSTTVVPQQTNDTTARGTAANERLMCRNFQQGNCVFGLACRFRHKEKNNSPDRVVVKPPITGSSFQWKPETPSFKTTTGETVLPAAIKNEDYTRPSCRFFAAGNCKLGSSCTFRHTEIYKSTQTLRVNEVEKDVIIRVSAAHYHCFEYN